jgi:L-ribulose-5-phosphate 3-epimerase
MTLRIDRRRFVQASGMFLAGAAAPAVLGRPAAAPSAGNVKKALCFEMIQGKGSAEERLRMAKDAGFDGVEINCQRFKKNGLDPKELARASAKLGLPIHGVSGAAGDLVGAIEEAKIYGATTVLHVARADANEPYVAHYRKAQELLRAAAPAAEKNKVTILVENVWATFLIEPMMMARFLDEIGNPYVKAYFDVGNVMRWGLPEQWIEVLGKRIGKIHIKEYDLNVAMNEGMRKAFNVPIGQGSIDWNKVCAQLRAIGFKSWATAEVRGGDLARLTEIAQEMDKVLHY